MDIERIRGDFPLLNETDLVYLDNACQTLRPRQVIDAIVGYYEGYPACGGRSVHRLATRVSIAMDASRESIARLIGSPTPERLVFTKNCTEGLNMVARGLPFERGDVVLTTDIEHNSNSVPWLRLQADGRLERRCVPTSDDGVFDIEALEEAMTDEVRLISMVQTSNSTGTSIPVEEVVKVAHDHGALVMLDGAQAAPHCPIDLEALDVDIYSFSMHKMLGPSGVGVLYAKEDVLESMEPLISGGGAVSDTSYDHMDMLPPPERFEAGLHDYAGIIGSGAAAEYLMDVGMDNVCAHDAQLNSYATRRLMEIPSVSIVGPEDPALRSSILPFNVAGLNPPDVAMALDDIGGVLIRSGMHCCHAFFRSRGLRGAARASFYLYNSLEDCDRFADAVMELVRKLRL